MKQSISLEIIDDQVKVITPYNEQFVQRCRNFRGTFKAGAWWFDDSIIDYVREAMEECFGTTGETPYETCTLLITDYDGIGEQRPVVLFGRQIVRAFGRDSGAKLCDGIIFISGSYSSGGSAKHWCTKLEKATFEIHSFPVPSLQLPEVQEAIEEGWCEVKYSKKKRTPEDIQADIEACKARMEELENELSNN